MSTSRHVVIRATIVAREELTASDRRVISVTSGQTNRYATGQGVNHRESRFCNYEISYDIVPRRYTAWGLSVSTLLARRWHNTSRIYYAPMLLDIPRLARSLARFLTRPRASDSRTRIHTPSRDATPTNLDVNIQRLTHISLACVTERVERWSGMSFFYFLLLFFSSFSLSSYLFNDKRSLISPRDEADSVIM